MTTPLDGNTQEKPLLLLVDDQPANLHLMVEILREEYRIKTVTKGSEALGIAARDPRPDLILLDVMMPELNGVEVLHQLRVDKKMGNIPVIFISADASEQTQFKGLDDGADDYVVKPIQPLALLARVRNLLRRKRAEDALERLNQELEQRIEERTLALSIAKEAAETANRAKNAFLRTVSHELRTPMNAILGFTDIAKYSASDPEQMQYLETVTKASEQLLAIINGIIDVSEKEANRLTLEKVNFTVGRVLEDAINRIGNNASEKGLKLNTEVAPEIVDLPLQGDPKRIGQVLSNLIDNAVKFTAQGAVSVHLTLDKETQSDVCVRFEVRDTGIGIAQKDQDRVFDTFQQADGSLTRSYGGTGLGLAIARRLVRSMGGKLGVNSQPGVGSTFWFTVCLAKQQSSP